MPLPEIINTGFKLEESKLWATNIPVEDIDITELEHNLDIPYLEQEDTDDWNLTPRMLILNFEKEKSHAEKVKKADLKYPIEIYNHKGNWIILDGVHRFIKAVQLGHKTIQVRKVSEEVVRKTRKSDKGYRKWKGEL